MAQLDDQGSAQPPDGAGVISPRRRDTLGSVLRTQAERNGDRPFLLFERDPRSIEVTTWRQQAERSHLTANALYNLGVRPGDRVGVHLTNCPEFYDVWFGSALLGAAIVPTNPLSTVDELRYITAHADCVITITQKDMLDTARKAGARRVIDITGDWLSGAQAPANFSAVDPLAVAAILYTSGTTSHPKGVLVTHAAYLNAGDAVANHLRMRPDDRQLIVLPIFHGNAQYYSSMSAFVTGASIALAPRFSASRWSDQAKAMAATVSSLFAAPMRMILAQQGSASDRSHPLRIVIYAQSLSVEQSGRFERRFGVPIAQLYGMTETVIPPLMNPLYEHRDPLSMGRPIAGARLRVVDDQGIDLPPGVAGNLLVFGEPGITTMAGYLDNSEGTEQALRGNWLRTGDVASVNGGGYFYFVDRAKEMIKRAGENVSCAEVEAVINSHPGVFECAVIGIPDRIRDQALLAFVVLRPGAANDANEILSYCRDRLSKFKIPDSVEFVEDLPRTSVGKIRKHVLRDRSA